MVVKIFELADGASKSICCGSPGKNATTGEGRPNKLSSLGQD